MAPPPRIDIATLRSQVNALLDLFEQQGVRSVAIANDFYWSVPWGSETVEGEGGDEPELVIGSLADDVEFLDGMQDEPAALMLCHVAPVLHYLGQRAADLKVF